MLPETSLGCPAPQQAVVPWALMCWVPRAGWDEEPELELGSFSIWQQRAALGNTITVLDWLYIFFTVSF